MVKKSSLIEGKYYLINGNAYKYNGLDGGNKPVFVIAGNYGKGVPAMFVFDKNIEELTIDLAYNNGELHLIQYLKEHGKRYKIQITYGMVKDFGIDEDTTFEDVEQYANDYLSDIATEWAEYAARREDDPSLDMDLNY